MNHEALERKLANLEEEIRLAQAATLAGTTMLSRAALSLDDALRVAANIRNRLSGTTRAPAKHRAHAGKGPADVAATG